MLLAFACFLIYSAVAAGACAAIFRISELKPASDGSCVMAYLSSNTAISEHHLECGISSVRKVAVSDYCLLRIECLRTISCGRPSRAHTMVWKTEFRLIHRFTLSISQLLLLS
jgi:hypothetical protein